MRPGRRPRLAATPAGVRLCAQAELRAAGSRSFVLRMGEPCFHGFAVCVGGETHGYVDACPHMGLPLEDVGRGYLAPDRVGF